MGSSFVRYRGKGFWVHDDRLEVWLLLMVAEIDNELRKSMRPAPWLAELRDEWQIQATAGFMGYVSPDLDRFLTTEERKNLVLDLAGRAMQRLGSFGEFTSIGEHWEIDAGTTRDFRTERFAIMGDNFSRLLRGEMETDDASFPIPYSLDG